MKKGLLVVLSVCFMLVFSGSAFAEKIGVVIASVEYDNSAIMVYCAENESEIITGDPVVENPSKVNIPDSGMDKARKMAADKKCNITRIAIKKLFD